MSAYIRIGLVFVDPKEVAGACCLNPEEEAGDQSCSVLLRNGKAITLKIPFEKLCGHFMVAGVKTTQLSLNRKAKK